MIRHLRVENAVHDLTEVAWSHVFVRVQSHVSTHRMMRALFADAMVGAAKPSRFTRSWGPRVVDGEISDGDTCTLAHNSAAGCPRLPPQRPRHQVMQRRSLPRQRCCYSILVDWPAPDIPRRCKHLCFQRCTGPEASQAHSGFAGTHSPREGERRKGLRLSTSSQEIPID